MRSTFSIFDIDGTLSDDSLRRHYYEQAKKATQPREKHELLVQYHAGLDGDPVMATGVSLLNNHIRAGSRIILLTARPSILRALTVHWLERNCSELNDYVLLMRPTGNELPSSVVKCKLLREHFSSIKPQISSFISGVYVFDDQEDILRSLASLLLQMNVPVATINTVEVTKHGFRRVDFQSSGWKDKKSQEKKDDPSLIPGEGIEALAAILSYGKQKYGENTWLTEPATPKSHVGSAMRHVAAWLRGERFDMESGKPHLDHAMTQLMMASVLQKRAKVSEED